MSAGNDWRQRAARNYQRIKAYYESRGGTRWEEVTADPRFFVSALLTTSIPSE